MGDIKKFGALNTKIRVLERELLGDEDYKALLNCNSISESIDYFKNNTAYGKLFNRKTLKNLSDIEQKFNDNLLQKYDKIISFLHIDYKPLLKKMLLRYEVENLKVYSRKIVANSSIEKLHENIRNIKYSKINYKKLSKAKNFYEFVEFLKGTDYYRILDYYKDSENKLFYIEMRLDLYYFSELTKITERLIGKNKKDSIAEILKKNIDLLNIQWIYRGLKNYNLTKEELLNYVILSGYYYNYKRLKTLCYSKSIDDLINNIKNSKYGFLFNENEDFELLMERNVERYIYKLFYKLNKKTTMDINKPLAYIHSVEYEMRDIFTILEGIKYKRSKQEIEKMLVRTLEGRGEHWQ